MPIGFKILVLDAALADIKPAIQLEFCHHAAMRRPMWMDTCADNPPIDGLYMGL